MTDFNYRPTDVDYNYHSYESNDDDYISGTALEAAAAAHRGPLIMWVICFFVLLLSFAIPPLDYVYGLIGLFAFVPPALICYKYNNSEDPDSYYIMAHAKSSLIFQILILIYDKLLIGFILSGMAAASNSAAIILFIVALAFVTPIVCLILMIRATSAAKNGEPYKYFGVI